jgi:hypothetical protein
MARSLCLLLLLSTTSFADPITVTILNQTIQTEVQAQIGGSSLSCDNVGVYSASCDLTVPATQGAAIGNASVNLSGPVLVVATGTNNGGYLTASASLTDTVLITGGTGTGYLNVAFTDEHGGPYSQPGYLIVNGQFGVLSPSNYFDQTTSGVFTFQFGQPFSYSIALYQSTDPSDTGQFDQVFFLDARIYPTQPTACGFNFQTGIYGVCSDPNFVPARILGAPIPEPNTLWLASGALALALVSRRAVCTRC